MTSTCVVCQARRNKGDRKDSRSPDVGHDWPTNHEDWCADQLELDFDGAA